jgi:ferrous iron transport protein B
MSCKTIVIVGQPNSGKSSLFQVLSDIKASFSGTTVALNMADIDILGERFRIVDLPGIYSLNPTDAAEEITYRYLINNNVDLVINVVDSTMVARSLELTVELIEFGLPVVIALNMQDEAERHGITVDSRKLESLLKVPVVPTTARQGKGVKQLIDRCYEVMINEAAFTPAPDYTHHLESRLTELSGIIEPLMNGVNGSKRFYAIKSIENPKILPPDFISKLGSIRDRIEDEIFDMHKRDSFETISYERHHIAMKIAEKVTVFKKRKAMPLTEKLDGILLHPYWGYGILLSFFFVYFFTIFVIGGLLSKIIEYPIAEVATLIHPLHAKNDFLWHTLNGAHQGLSGALGVVLPYFLPLVMLTAIFEETGYLARIAFLIDGLMHKMGLHGKSVVPFMLGFGCSAPALYATRTLENKRDRVITGLLIPFIPCSARISVIFALSAAFAGPVWAVVIFIYVILITAHTGKLLSKFMTLPQGLILEIPVLKVPSLKVSAGKTVVRLKEFLKDTLLFLIIGGIVLGWIEYFNIAHYINAIISPVIDTVLGLPEKLGSTLVFGFFRKELIVVMANQALGVQSLSQLPMSTKQVVVFIIFVTLYFPCFTTFVVIWREFGAKVAAGSSVLSIAVATISAFLFKIALSIRLY